MSVPVADQPLKVVNPRDGFRFYAASEHMNLPAMYLSTRGDSQVVTVVARGFEHEFALKDFVDAVTFYLIAARENGYKP
jgi:hypothetical protein